MYAADDPPPLAASHLRITRPSRDLAQPSGSGSAAWTCRCRNESNPRQREHELVIPGWPGAAGHLELVSDPDGQTPPAPPKKTC